MHSSWPSTGLRSIPQREDHEETTFNTTLSLCQDQGRGHSVDKMKGPIQLWFSYKPNEIKTH